MNDTLKLAVLEGKSATTDQSAEERMYREIYDAIMEHRLPAKTKLAEQSLAEIYQLARHGVRKVLGQLAADGLVDLEPNRGAFIASPSEQEAQDMFELRQSLEQLVLEKIVQSTTHDKATQLTALREMVERERTAYMQGDRSLWIRLSADFHIELAKLSGNQLLVDMLRRLVSRTTLLISSLEASGAPASAQPCSFDEHLNVITALEQKDRTTALHAMAHHLEQCACRTQKKADKGFDLRAALGKSRSA
ncbi:DNA-binding GntR family transcriptional regulator [Undibacterium sp. GrIS 1.2]|uniref:GntR family transcriptional regulator n=1 Tax=Undibacterium sp. GrIS 1.2 TaxID=3143933 RepID=UPI0033938B34